MKGRIASILAALAVLVGGAATFFAVQPAPTEQSVTSLPFADVVIATDTPTPYPPMVPTAFAPLYATVSANVASFTDLSKSVPLTTTNNVVFGTTLSALNGQDMQATQTITAVNLELDRLKYLGVQAVTVGIPYPDFLPWYSQSTSLLAFYQKVDQAVLAHGMKLVIERGDSPNNTFTFPDFCTYEREQQQINQTILDQLTPYELWVVDELSTREDATGYAEFGNVISATNYVAYEAGDAADPDCPQNTLVAINKHFTLLAAGQGSWEDTANAQGFATIPDIDVLDVHVFPLVTTTVHPFMQRIVDVANIAHQAGKGFSVTESWLNKQTDTEVPWAAGYQDLIGRDTFSFWQPQDQAFLVDLVRLASREGAMYISPYWSGYFESYLDYNPGTADENSASSLLRYQVTNLQYANRAAFGPFSQTGIVYCQIIALSEHTPCVALTPQPTNTPTPTITPRPTATPRPTRTPLGH